MFRGAASFVLLGLTDAAGVVGRVRVNWAGMTS